MGGGGPWKWRRHLCVSDGRTRPEKPGDEGVRVAQYDPATRKVPRIAAKIAARLLAAGRAEDTLGFIGRAEVDQSRWIPRAWQDARLEVLEALDRMADAQTFRRTCFERDLSPD
ncbi:MAG: hypothetical protein Q7V03_08970 [Cypionkella sp.]|jgi:hypothetical protein|nr:DUF6880 family protein [Cypionkella sp.]MDO8983738.1 hypothetical protein [Cypionkella sp.]MDP2051465.1 hypothetical protein [Cypionkella sp.]